MPSSIVNIDWNAIRPLNGSRANGFEELCSQIARVESPADSRFERKGTPDAGVECYSVLNDGSEWAWQAKYFDGFGESQWSQLDDSVKTALEKHPRLVRYFICIPLDRPDARINGRRSAKERWDEHVQKWTGWASDRSMAVEFIYWGSHELIQHLARTRHVGLVRFFFDVHGFDGAWFTARLDEAVKTAGPRYTREIHVDLPIATELEAFGRTERFFDQIKAHARSIRKKLGTFEYSESKSVEQTLDTVASALSSQVRTVLTELGAVTFQPVGVLPFQRIADQVASAEAVADELERLLLERERDYETKPPIVGIVGTSAEAASRSNNPFRKRWYRLMALSSELRKTHEALIHAQAVAGSALLLIKGAAGTGKTHLLCDVARQRVEANRPTLLLMGQRFVSQDIPWAQAIQQLDLPGLSAEEFVGALEAAAQAAGCRALVMIDALNEGAGRLIWPSHLAAFLAHLERSPWIGVLLSVRSAYEEIVVPDAVRAKATTITHEGFADHEYDAMRTFLVHYGLELPSTPLLAPEFRNPLFLKILCRGLNAKGERRLPRGLHGIVAILDLYLGAINERLASVLGFNPKAGLVYRALEAFAKALIDSGERWLTLAKAEEVVDALLPGREFERSLYRGLVVEGVLTEEAAWWREATREEAVFAAYDRFTDHLVAKTLLDAHLNTATQTSVFAEGGPLAFLSDDSHFVAPGLLEAMCIQVPERTGLELVSLAPRIGDRWGIGDAFRQSLIWRAPTAFSPGTRETLNKLVRNNHDLNDTIEVLLTVTTLPGHPFNAMFLDEQLRRDTMPERDAWWSIFLHEAWGSHGAVDRLVDWASSVTPDAVLDDETVDLCATALSWMLTTSNRFVRDRATKALVSLLTGRLAAVGRLVERFADVNDLYVAERVYAIAYGTAMRSYDLAEVGALAACVYARVFASSAPPAHILLRDYARGVVERAIHIGAKVDVDVARIRPPYKSQWPEIPTEDDINPLLPDWSRGSHDSRDIEWARNRIGSSVLADDFAFYVIGTNSSSASSHWLALKLGEPEWEPPEQSDNLLDNFVTELSEKEREAWETFDATQSAFEQASRPYVIVWLAKREAHEADELTDVDERTVELEKALPPEIAALEEERDAALTTLDCAFTEEHKRQLYEILAEKDRDREVPRPPRFELSQIQRYILWRVFDLGWTTERFGYFDRFSIGYNGRDASKAERIGKKYQWIAYHEIMALVADNFQYLEEFHEEDNDRAYDGPWQNHLRDIDPSCTLQAPRGGTSWDGHSPAWWATECYESWGTSHSPREWAMRYDDLPKVEDILSISHPADNSRWLNVQGYFKWRQQPPADQESTDVERRELWYISTGYLIRTRDIDIFMKWAEGVDFWGRWMPDTPEVHEMFLGEHGWSPASRYFEHQCSGDEGWAQPSHDCPVKVRAVALEYLREANGFDCSVDEGYRLRLPVGQLVTGLGLRWSGYGADYVDATGQLAAFDPTVYANGPSTLLLREDLLRGFLAREKLSLCWIVLGEKSALGAGFNPAYHVSLRMTGAYLLDNKGLVGFLKRIPTDQVIGDRDSLRSRGE
jgi:hypothetical protein